MFPWKPEKPVEKDDFGQERVCDKLSGHCFGILRSKKRPESKSGNAGTETWGPSVRKEEFTIDLEHHRFLVFAEHLAQRVGNLSDRGI